MVRIGAYSVFDVRRIIASVPQHAFGTEVPAVPDYDDLSSWSAHPSRPLGRSIEDANHLVLPGETLLPVEARPCDCFFLHDSCFNPPETFPFLGSCTPCWNAPVSAPEGSPQARLAAKVNEQVDWSVAADASCLNGMCRIYAPRYRQSSVLSYAHFMQLPVVGQRLQDARRSFELAYEDVRHAFHAFLRLTSGRPFILASHSQGTQHMVRLLQEEVEGHPDRLHRFVHGYLVGQAVPLNLFGRTLLRVSPSASAVDVCSVSCWRTARAGHFVSTGRGIETYDAISGWRRIHNSERLLATNPVTWTTSDQSSTAENFLHAAFPVPSSHDLRKYVGCMSSGVSLRLGHVSAKSQQTIGVQVNSLSLVKCEQVTVRVDSRDVTLVPRFASDCLFAVCERDWLLFHDLDYPLFYGNVRANVAERLRAWQQRSRL